MLVILTETGLGSTARCCGRRRHRQANSVRVCSPTSRRVASLRPRSAGLTALTSAPRTLVQTGSCRQCPLIHPLHVVVAVLSRMTPFPATVDTGSRPGRHAAPGAWPSRWPRRRASISRGHVSTTVLNDDGVGTVTVFRVRFDGVDTWTIKDPERTDSAAREELLRHNDYQWRLFWYLYDRAMGGEHDHRFPETAGDLACEWRGSELNQERVRTGPWSQGTSAATSQRPRHSTSERMWPAPRQEPRECLLQRVPSRRRQRCPLPPIVAE